MKSFPFIICMVIGLWVGYYLGVQKSSEETAQEVAPPTSDRDRELMQSFQDENTELRARIAELEGQLAELQQQLGISQP